MDEMLSPRQSRLSMAVRMFRLDEGEAQVSLNGDDFKEVFGDSGKVFILEEISQENFSVLLQQISKKLPKGETVSKLLVQVVLPPEGKLTRTQMRMFSNWMTSFHDCSDFFWGIYRQPREKRFKVGLRMIASLN